MDKICRGSRMGGSSPGASAGSWAALESQHRRGGFHISKIDNMGPSSRRPLKTSDTYKSSDWFRHDAGGQSTPRMPWPEVGSPRVARSLLAQSKSAAALGSAGADQQGLSPCAGNMGSCSPRNIDASPAEGSFGAGGMLRGRSESWLGAALPGSPRTAGSPQQRAGSPAWDLFNGEARARSAEKRVKSPTFTSSEAWMRYSSPRNSGSQGCHLDEPASPGAPSSMRRCKSADGLPGSDEAATEAIAGLRASLSAAGPGRRRKQAGGGGTVKDGDHTKRRLQQDPTQQFDNNQPRSQRRHDFPVQAIASEDAANATPSGSCSVPYPGCGIVRSGSPGGRRPMHQSSIETTTSLMPEITPPPQVPTKYIVGGEHRQLADVWAQGGCVLRRAYCGCLRGPVHAAAVAVPAVAGTAAAATAAAAAAAATAATTAAAAAATTAAAAAAAAAAEPRPQELGHGPGVMVDRTFDGPSDLSALGLCCEPDIEPCCRQPGHGDLGAAIDHLKGFGLYSCWHLRDQVHPAGRRCLLAKCQEEACFSVNVLVSVARHICSSAE
eukprot:CAMPEP_0203897000 /NCGR_PEP_ID=MMETSP0359-20131031/39687_1 /ASSEMBLY_ACC=CAM_ASM_000338 /TAXON_ID=268821 /ORGANISM="Scrippsiella Hangoei, Strain SHTV-5" /LENGTH=551 /DNA_ID=CAMNT_0050819801 /DNA_START=17 /DNA_END=1668 /DNA_ORIENTATION=+